MSKFKHIDCKLSWACLDRHINLQKIKALVDIYLDEHIGSDNEEESWSSDNHLRTPLIIVGFRTDIKNKYDIVKTLLRIDKMINYIDKYQYNILHSLRCSETTLLLDLVKLLIDNNVNLNYLDPHHEENFLQRLCGVRFECDTLPIVKLVTSSGISINNKNLNLINALYFACVYYSYNDRANVAKFLIKIQSNVNIVGINSKGILEILLINMSQN